MDADDAAIVANIPEHRSPYPGCDSGPLRVPRETEIAVGLPLLSKN
ncbi:hypothetical protein LE191_20950 [Janthinobacterium sp. HSC-3S05]|nr:hypothetical protein [Janthinobacterium lividum]MCA1862580.1 hypothetical protein [Janthinobacterium lividum]